MTRREFTKMAAAFEIASATGISIGAEDSASPKGKALVVYFSHTGENYGVGNITEGNTAIVAKMIAKETGGKLFEIEEVKPYPKDDYGACCKVAQKEEREGARPAIKADFADFEQYDTIFIGFPIWYGDAPMPVYTFIDKHGWKGKTVVPFCTHEGSRFGKSVRHLKEVCKEAKFLDGLEMTGRTAQKERDEAAKYVKDWLAQLGFKKEA